MSGQSNSGVTDDSTSNAAPDDFRDLTVLAALGEYQMELCDVGGDSNYRHTGRHKLKWLDFIDIAATVDCI
jgi:hypothetical protein